MVIEAVNKLRPNTTMFRRIIVEIRIVKSSMVICSFNHIKRVVISLLTFHVRRAVLATNTNDVWLENLQLDLDNAF